MTKEAKPANPRNTLSINQSRLPTANYLYLAINKEDKPMLNETMSQKIDRKSAQVTLKALDLFPDLLAMADAEEYF